MTKLKQSLRHLKEHYPHKRELTDSKLTKLLYLADWKSAVNKGKVITDIKWDLQYVTNTNSSIPTDFYEPTLTLEEKEILDEIIRITKDKYHYDFMEFIYSTYPVKSNKTDLNLIEIAKEFREKYL